MTLIGKIRAIFVTASVVIGALFWIAYGIQMEHFQQKLLDRFMQVAPFCRTQALHKSSHVPDIDRQLVTGGFTPTVIPGLPETRPQHAKTVLVHTMPMGTATILQEGTTYYLRFRTTAGDQWLQNTEPPPTPTSLLAWYGISLATLWLLYLWLARSLRPLKTLHRAVEQIKQGDLSISTRNPRRDEIAQVANTLDDALRKIEALIHSRQLFLHAIMHELKTPIAKGKLLNAFLEESEQKERYEALFDRLDLLLGEFAKIEQMLTANYTLKIASYSVENLVEHALELMLLDPEQIAKHIHRTIDPGVTFQTDFNLVTLALKNLIDNAFKHSSDQQVILTTTPDALTIRNHGEPLSQPLEAYREPFGASSGGLGLGLYIVLNIVEVLGMKLVYRHEEGLNSFVLRQVRG